MTKRDEAEEAMRYGPKYATEDKRVGLLREAINEAVDAALEEAAKVADAVAAPARLMRDTLDTSTPMGRTGYQIAETRMDTAAVIADDIRALKKGAP